jgi:hypothetical protein
MTHGRQWPQLGLLERRTVRTDVGTDLHTLQMRARLKLLVWAVSNCLTPMDNAVAQLRRRGTTKH